MNAAIKDIPIRIGLVGFGHWGRNLARTFSNCDGSHLAVIADIHPDHRELASQQYPKARITSSIFNLLKDQSTDGIAVATPTMTHEKLVTTSLLEGRHVLVAKPMTTSLSAAQRLVSLANYQGRVLSVDYTYLHNPYITTLSHMIHRGDIGRLLATKAIWWNNKHCQTDIDVIYDLASHVFSIVALVTGAVPTSVRLESSGGMPLSKARLLCHCVGGVSTFISVDFKASPKRRLFIACGTNGVLMYQDDVRGELLSILSYMPNEVDYTGRDGPGRWRVVPVNTNSEALSKVVATFVSEVKGSIKVNTSSELAINIHRAIRACHSPKACFCSVPTHTKTIDRKACAKSDFSLQVLSNESPISTTFDPSTKDVQTYSDPTTSFSEKDLETFYSDIEHWPDMLCTFTKETRQYDLIPAGTSSLFAKLLHRMSDIFYRHNDCSDVFLRFGGSLAHCAMLPTSDVDAVLFGPRSAVPILRRMRTAIVEAISQIGLSNSDIIVVTHQGQVIDLPLDPIDQRIALFSVSESHKDPCNGLLLDHVTFSSDFLLEAIVAAWLLRIAPPPPGKEQDPKYRRGGSRDAANIVEISLMAEKLTECQDVRSRLEDARHLALQARRLFQRIALHKYLRASRSNKDGNDTHKHLPPRILRSVDMMFNELTQACLVDYPVHIQQLFWQLLNVAESEKGLSEQDLATLTDKDSPRALIALGIFALSEWSATPSIFNDKSQCALTCLAAALNPCSSKDVLDMLTQLQGYEWRNIRDQLLKNPSLPTSAVVRLTDDALPFTRRRACQVLVARRCENPFSRLK